MRRFEIETENVGTDEVLVRVIADEGVVFTGGSAPENKSPFERIYPNGATVSFRVGEGEPVTTLAMRKSFSMASRFTFERGV